MDNLTKTVIAAGFVAMFAGLIFGQVLVPGSPMATRLTAMLSPSEIKRQEQWPNNQPTQYIRPDARQLEFQRRQACDRAVNERFDPDFTAAQRILNSCVPLHGTELTDCFARHDTAMRRYESDRADAHNHCWNDPQ